MSGLRSRRKGHGFERAIATEFRALFPELAASIRRGWQSRAGNDEPDVIVPYFTIECKAQRRCNIKAALKQAEENNERFKETKYPVAICKDDRQTPVVAMYLPDFLELVKEWYERGKR